MEPFPRAQVLGVLASCGIATARRGDNAADPAETVGGHGICRETPRKVPGGITVTLGVGLSGTGIVNMWEAVFGS